MGFGEETNVHRARHEENSHLDFPERRCCYFFLCHTSESSHFVTCVYSCMKLYSQLHTTRFVLVLNNKPCVYHLVNVLRLDPALCGVGFTAHIWDITTPGMCLCVYVPTDEFMSPTQHVCVCGHIGWFTVWCCTLCELFSGTAFL